MTSTLKVVLNTQSLRGVTDYLSKFSLDFVTEKAFFIKNRKKTNTCN